MVTVWTSVVLLLLLAVAPTAGHDEPSGASTTTTTSPWSTATTEPTPSSVTTLGARQRAPRPGRRPTPATVESRLAWPRSVISTAYGPGCGAGPTASGKEPYVGSAAMNGVPFGSRWRVVETAAVYTVEDRIGHGSGLDIYMASCAAARRYGRRGVHLERLA